MQISYYVMTENDGETERVEFQDASSLQYYLVHAGQKADPNGEVYLTGLDGLKIVYNTHTGAVRLENIEKQEWITHDFSSEVFQSSLTPVINAIRKLAKMELLLELYNLKDAGICRIIEPYFDKEKGKIRPPIDELAVDQVLMDLQIFVLPKNKIVSPLIKFFSGSNKKTNVQEQTPIQKAIDAVFDECDIYSGLERITSGSVVADLLEKISQKNIELSKKKPCSA